MGGTSCKAKIILNGSSIYNEAEELCAQVEATDAETFDYEAGLAMVGLLNAAEDAVFAAKRVFLEMNGFSGPWPASLDNSVVRQLVAAARKEADHGSEWKPA